MAKPASEATKPSRITPVGRPLATTAVTRATQLAPTTQAADRASQPAEAPSAAKPMNTTAVTENEANAPPAVPITTRAAKAPGL